MVEILPLTQKNWSAVFVTQIKIYITKIKISRATSVYRATNVVITRKNISEPQVIEVIIKDYLIEKLK